MKKSPGFSLIELLTVISIISILAALCFPLYSQYMMKARRLEAASMLSRLAIAMEKYHIENNTYETATLASLSFPASIANNNYRLVIEATSNNYKLIAEPMEDQARKDTVCAALILHANGVRAVTGPAKIHECW